jgi:hypothetical protein
MNNNTLIATTGTKVFAYDTKTRKLLLDEPLTLTVTSRAPIIINDDEFCFSSRQNVILWSITRGNLSSFAIPVITSTDALLLHVRDYVFICYHRQEGLVVFDKDSIVHFKIKGYVQSVQLTEKYLLIGLEHEIAVIQLDDWSWLRELSPTGMYATVQTFGNHSFVSYDTNDLYLEEEEVTIVKTNVPHVDTFMSITEDKLYFECGEEAFLYDRRVNKFGVSKCKKYGPLFSLRHGKTMDWRRSGFVQMIYARLSYVDLSVECVS